MRFIFRADASLDIGTGHVMRCLTLADALRDKGAECYFICREHPGHLIDQIRARNHQVYALPLQESLEISKSNKGVHVPAYARWLGASQEQDAQICGLVLRQLQPDWLIVDHYALDEQWETTQRGYCAGLMVIDDLADRQHDCDLLLDQTLGRQAWHYRSLVPEKCTLLCGSKYALLRPEFAHWRPYSLARREQPELKHLLVTMGGVDRDNAAGQILNALERSSLPDECRISVVMGRNAPWISQVRQKAAQLVWPTSVLVGVTDMARLMANSDLAIGAAGATSWERCCLGLPTLLMVLADNQVMVAQSLEQVGAAQIVNQNLQVSDALSTWTLPDLGKSLDQMTAMTHAAANVVDGEGTERLVYTLFGEDNALA